MSDFRNYRCDKMQLFKTLKALGLTFLLCLFSPLVPAAATGNYLVITINTSVYPVHDYLQLTKTPPPLNSETLVAPLGGMENYFPVQSAAKLTKVPPIAGTSLTAASIKTIIIPDAPSKIVYDLMFDGCVHGFAFYTTECGSDENKTLSVGDPAVMLPSVYTGSVYQPSGVLLPDGSLVYGCGGTSYSNMELCRASKTAFHGLSGRKSINYYYGAPAAPQGNVYATPPCSAGLDPNHALIPTQCVYGRNIFAIHADNQPHASTDY